MTLGDLSEEDVERIRSGAIGDPSVGQVAALAGVFGVEPSYLLDRGNRLYSMNSSCRRYGMMTCETLPEECAATRGREAASIGYRATVQGPEGGSERLELARVQSSWCVVRFCREPACGRACCSCPYRSGSSILDLHNPLLSQKALSVRGFLLL